MLTLYLHISLSYRDLQDQLLAAIVRRQGIENRWKLLSIEFHCN